MLAINESEYLNRISPHNQYFRIILLEKGSIKVCLNGAIVTLLAPFIICLNNKDTLIPDNENMYKISSVYFYPSVVNNYFDLENIYINSKDESLNMSILQDKLFLISFLERNSYYKGFIPVTTDVAARIKLLVKKIKNVLVYQDDQFWPCRSRSYLFELLITLEICHHDLLCEGTTVHKDGYTINTENILEYIHMNYSKKITLNSLSKEFNINRTTLNQHFLESTGDTAIAYLIKHRLIVANTLLRNTSLSISQISERVGFNDITSFGRSFKKQYGVPPSRIRRAIC